MTELLNIEGRPGLNGDARGQFKELSQSLSDRQRLKIGWSLVIGRVIS